MSFLDPTSTMANSSSALTGDGNLKASVPQTPYGMENPNSGAAGAADGIPMKVSNTKSTSDPMSRNRPEVVDVPSDEQIRAEQRLPGEVGRVLSGLSRKSETDTLDFNTSPFQKAPPEGRQSLLSTIGEFGSRFSLEKVENILASGGDNAFFELSAANVSVQAALKGLTEMTKELGE